MNSHNIDDLLRRLDPARHEPIPEPDSVLGRRIRNEGIDTGRSRWGQRSGLVAAVAAAVIVFAGSAAAFLLTTGSSPDPVQTLCYGVADFDTDGVGVAVTTSPDVSDCYRFWQDGTFADDGEVPPLVACVRDPAGLAVLPGDGSVCTQLGLTVADPNTQGDPVAVLQARLDALIPAGSCAPFDETVASMRNVVASLDLPGWQVEVRTEPGEERPCASFSIEGTNKTVVVVPIPG